MTPLPLRIAVAAAIALAGTLHAADEPATSPDSKVFGWRFDGSGVFPDAQPLLAWSPTTNVLWAAKLPKVSNSAPVVAGDAVFCCAEPWTLLCLDRATGAIRWQKSVSAEDATPPDEQETYRRNRPLGQQIQKEIGLLQAPYFKDATELKAHPDDADLKARMAEEMKKINAAKKTLEPYLDAVDPGIHPACGWSVYTPVTDGSHVWAVFSTGVAICCDLQGNLAWARRLERPAIKDPYSASPLLCGGKLVIQLGDLKAFDAATGEPAWSTTDIPRSFGSPIIVRLGQVPAILTPSGCLVRLADGHVLAKGLTAMRDASPIVHDGVAYFIEGNALALKLPGSDAEPVKATKVWQKPKLYEAGYEEVYVASPIWVDGVVYVVSRTGELIALDAADGSELYRHQFDGDLGSFTSIASAGGHLFVSTARGTTFVLVPGRSYQEVGRNDLAAPGRSGPVFVGDRIYARAGSALFCIGR